MELVQHEAPNSHTLNQQLLSGLCKAGASRAAFGRYINLLAETPSLVCTLALIPAFVSCHCNAELVHAMQCKLLLHRDAHLHSFQCQHSQVCMNVALTTSEAATCLFCCESFAKRSDFYDIHLHAYRSFSVSQKR